MKGNTKKAKKVNFSTIMLLNFIHINHTTLLLLLPLINLHYLTATDTEIAVDFSPLLRIYKSGRIERLQGETIVPPSLNPQNGVVSKDVVYSPENNLSLRIFLPHHVTQKLPLLVYFHGGGFIIETAFSPTYHTFLTSVVAAVDCIAVSVDYRRAPEHPIPIPYEDSWTALKWIFTHVSGSGQEHWLNQHADFNKVFFAGDSAGGNIAHHMAMKAGKEKLTSLYTSVDPILYGMILVHPFFWGKTPIDKFETRNVKVRAIMEKYWEIASPNSKDGADDPLINVVGSDSVDLSGLCCGKVLVMVAEEDPLVRQGWCYATKLKKSSWEGEVEVMETKHEGHVFYLRDPNTQNAHQFLKKFADFLKG